MSDGHGLGELDRRLFGLIRDGFPASQPSGIGIPLFLNRKLQGRSLPAEPSDFLATKGTQISGYSGKPVDVILREHGIVRSIGTEAGRTSRGSVDLMTTYVRFINDLHADGLIIWTVIEKFWVLRANEYFNAKPLVARIKPSSSMVSVIKDVLDQVLERQRQMPGTMLIGIVMQHLVGAKLEIALRVKSPGSDALDHHHANQNDSGSGRGGDFDIGDAAIHVTATPSEALLRKCMDNIEKKLNPIIITLREGRGTADLLAKQLDMVGRVEVFEFETFIAGNVQELSGFTLANRLATARALLERYNGILDEVGHEPWLKIQME